MAVVDVNAWAGSWASQSVNSGPAEVRGMLKSAGVERIFMSVLDAAWAQNPHQANELVYEAAQQWSDVHPVPIIDPTIATWAQEVSRAQRHAGVRLVKWLPAYGGYELGAADACAQALVETDLSLMIQTRIEDPRRQHPLAQVPDVPAREVADLAGRHPKLTVVIGGAAWSAIADLAGACEELGNLYFDVSQVDGMDSLTVLIKRGMRDRLLFGSHAPLFVPLAGIARIVADLEDADAAAILGGNAESLLGLTA
jgi:predicted TIM-barrel fold metal-dependent hydrolase